MLCTAPSARSCRRVKSRRKWAAILTFISRTLAGPKIMKFYLLLNPGVPYGCPQVDSRLRGRSGKALPSRGRHREANGPMDQHPTLDAYLASAAPSLPQGNALATVISRLARAAVELAELIAAGPLAGINGAYS